MSPTYFGGASGVSGTAVGGCKFTELQKVCTDRTLALVFMSQKIILLRVLRHGQCLVSHTCMKTLSVLCY